MAKKDSDDFNSAEDYLSQLEWKAAKQYRRSSVYYEPKWKYKITYKEEPVSSYLPLVIFSVIAIIIFVFLLYLIFIKHSFGAIFGLIFFILLTSILFFAIQDAESGSKNDSDEN
jgi:uncharacterized membrane protein